MDILDILIAKNQSFSAETAKLTQQAKAAMAKANEVAIKIDEAQDALDAAEAANTRAQEVAESFDELQEDLEAAVDNIIDDKIDTAISSISSSVNEAVEAASEAVTEVEVIDANTSTAKIKKTRVQKNGNQQLYEVMKNYTTTGQNEDGSMTQKAITQALQTQKTELENKIRNIPSGGSSGSGNISGNISAEDEGSIVAVGENGNITPSTITEIDVIKTQIITGTYKNNEIIGVEIDYQNKTFTRLQGAVGRSAGNDFNNFTMFSGRKRCVVNEDGSIIEFITSETNKSSLAGKRIMVYQPAFYYMRIPLSISGNIVNKEHLYLADKKFAGFTLHPAFLDSNGNAVKFILLPAFESAAIRTSNNELVTNDAQDVDLQNDKLISTINIKPISGYTQNFNYFAAQTMCRNNGDGWDMTTLEMESINQMLMTVEYGTMNVRSLLGKGIVDFSNTTTNNASITGSTYDLYNTSGAATETINNGTNYTVDGKKAISYRGMENPYGGMWRFVNNAYVENGRIRSDYQVVTTSGWINSFACYDSMNWAYLPIDVDGNANSNLPVGSYVYASETSYVIFGGGYAAGNNVGGPFYYHYNNNTAETHYYNDSARIMFTPTANSTIETNNYNTWINS